LSGCESHSFHAAGEVDVVAAFGRAVGDGDSASRVGRAGGQGPSGGCKGGFGEGGVAMRNLSTLLWEREGKVGVLGRSLGNVHFQFELDLAGPCDVHDSRCSANSLCFLAQSQGLVLEKDSYRHCNSHNRIVSPCEILSWVSEVLVGSGLV